MFTKLRRQKKCAVDSTSKVHEHRGLIEKL